MKIEITKPLKPFSHKPGSCCIIPHSAWQCIIFPCKIKLKSHTSQASVEVDIDLQGPVKDFTIEQDLEEGRIRVFGIDKRGYFRYVLKQKQEGLTFTADNFASETMRVSIDGNSCCLAKGQSVILSQEVYEPRAISKEKLCLGQHKSQDWSGIRNRADLSEIFPLWLRLGQIVTKGQPSCDLQGMMALLKKCQDTVDLKQRSLLKQSFLDLFSAGFSSMLSPRLFDDEYQGIVESTSSHLEQNALELLHKGSELIRSLFFQECDGVYHLLPCLPHEFICGRFAGVCTSSEDKIDILWSKGWIRLVIIRVASTKTISLSLQKEIKSYRMKKDKRACGTILTVDQPISCKEGDVIYLDRFER